MGPSELIYNRPLHPYTQALLSATPTIHPDPSKPKIKISGELPQPTVATQRLRFPPTLPACQRTLPG